jgi:hypothetical protein
MRWRRSNDWPAYRPPQRAKLPAEALAKIHAMTQRFVARSPVLVALIREVELARGRIYLWWAKGDLMARITPLSTTEMLLESPYGASFTEHARATLPRILAAVERDPRGTLHGLGSLTAKRPARPGARGAKITAQQELRDVFGVPLRVIAEPRHWYAMRRAPRIVERDPEGGRALVELTATGLFGGFGGTCLYARRDGEWGCYTVKPSASRSIADAEAWLVKRGWEDWG